MRILANDGIEQSGKELLEQNGIEVITQHIPQEDLLKGLSSFDGIFVRSATQVTEEIIDANPQLKVIGRGGVGMDNIAVEYGTEKGIHVINTPLASTRSVAELSIAFMFSGMRNLHTAFHQMPENGTTNFKALKKQLSKGLELEGRTLGLIGFGNIGKEVAKMAIGLGMDVLISTSQVGKQYRLELPNINLELEFTSIPKEQLIQASDIISLHLPKAESVVLGAEEFKLNPELLGVINTSRGALIDEQALISALKNGNLGFAGLDVFQNEPNVDSVLLQTPGVIATPHIGGSTIEAQSRVWIQLAEQVISIKGQ